MKIIIDELTVESIISKVIELDDEGEACGETDVTLGEAIKAELMKQVNADGRWTGLIAHRIRQIRDEEIRAAVRAQIEAAIEETDLRSMIIDEMKGLLCLSRSSMRSDRTVLRDIVEYETKSVVAKDLKDVLEEARTAVRAAANAYAAKLIAESQARMTQG